MTFVRPSVRPSATLPTPDYSTAASSFTIKPFVKGDVELCIEYTCSLQNKRLLNLLPSRSISKRPIPYPPIGRTMFADDGIGIGGPGDRMQSCKIIDKLLPAQAYPFLDCMTKLQTKSPYNSTTYANLYLLQAVNVNFGDCQISILVPM
jgi:hypothetical protein